MSYQRPYEKLLLKSKTVGVSIIPILVVVGKNNEVCSVVVVCHIPE